MFDLDGVLVDSEPLWEQVEREVVAALGFPWDPRIRSLLVGTGPLEASRVLADHLGAGVGAGDVQELMASISERRFAEGVAVAPGAERLLAALHGRVALAIATNSNHHLARTAVEGTGLHRYVDAVATVDDVDQAKPAPDVYLLACERIGARPSRSIALDDSLPGIAAAVAAKMWVVAVGQAVLPSGAAHGVASLLDLEADDLVA